MPSSNGVVWSLFFMFNPRLCHMVWLVHCVHRFCVSFTYDSGNHIWALRLVHTVLLCSLLKLLIFTWLIHALIQWCGLVIVCILLSHVHVYLQARSPLASGVAMLSSPHVCLISPLAGVPLVVANFRSQSPFFLNTGTVISCAFFCGVLQCHHYVPLFRCANQLYLHIYHQSLLYFFYVFIMFLSFGASVICWLYTLTISCMHVQLILLRFYV